MIDIKDNCKIFAALSNPHRLELFLKICQANGSSETDPKDLEKVCLLDSIKSTLNIGAPTLSHHVKQLELSGLIEVVKKGKFLVLNVNRQRLTDLLKIFDPEI